MPSLLLSRDWEGAATIRLARPLEPRQFAEAVGLRSDLAPGQNRLCKLAADDGRRRQLLGGFCSMRFVMVGAGYVALVSGACFADFVAAGHKIRRKLRCLFREGGGCSHRH